MRCWLKIRGIRRCQARAGLSIVEVLIATLLLSLVLGSAYPLLSQALWLMRSARDHYVASTICLARIERARDLDFALLSVMHEPSPGTYVDQDGVPLALGANGLPAQAANYRRSTQVTTNSPSSGLTQVQVTTQILNRKTGVFDGSAETMSCIFTHYLRPPGAP